MEGDLLSDCFRFGSLLSRTRRECQGEILKDIFSLLGTDEANRAALQALLNDPKVSVTAVDLLYSPSRGTWKSTKIPQVLVRTDLSTSNVPGVAAQNAVSDARFSQLLQLRQAWSKAASN